MRKFEKISFIQFKKDICDDKNLYETYNLPKRHTNFSAGYDIESLIEAKLKPGDTIKIPLGIKVSMYEDEMLMLLVRSGTGFKYNVRMCNQIGIIESDYYDNESNEGHLFIKLHNHGTKDFIINKGDRICQGVFAKFLTVENEEKINKTRKGGLGSTNKGEKNGK